ncbi:hypothetical protein EWM64_g3230 [Hericium alpestre]|uniref:BTB domain-containing protein n=1 Tax=Hericium alpestre TaxID=135208 RepID=A0A4Z0A123_9AGAM|nr:hypothetical protein EWM64_g3230 [Hericium alpestre]
MASRSTLRRHDALYFDDGNIVMSATSANNPGSVVFRVHKSVMAKHSPVFADMFSLPDTGTAAETYDGAPLICMPDAAEDLQKLLEALYCQPPFSLVPLSPHNPSIARPVLALSTKYEITHLRQLIVDRLEADWPLTLEKWDALEDMTMSQRSHHYRFPGPFIDDLFPEPASAIRLAHDFDIPTILPAAFYHLLRIPVADDWNLLHKDSPKATAEALWTGRRTAKWDLLRAEDLLTVLRGRDALLRALNAKMFSISLEPEHPEDEERCDKFEGYSALIDIVKGYFEPTT